MFQENTPDQLNIKSQLFSLLHQEWPLISEAMISSMRTNNQNKTSEILDRVRCKYSDVVAEILIQDARKRHSEEIMALKVAADIAWCQINQKKVKAKSAKAAREHEAWWDEQVLTAIQGWFSRRIDLDEINAECERKHISKLTLDDIAGAALVHRCSIINQNGQAPQERVFVNSGEESKLIKTRLNKHHFSILKNQFEQLGFCRLVQKHDYYQKKCAIYKMETTFFDDLGAGEK